MLAASDETLVDVAPSPPRSRLQAGGQRVSDVTGAGDTVTAALALGVAAGLDLSEAALLALLAAGFVVTQPGIAVVRPGELLPALS